MSEPLLTYFPEDTRRYLDEHPEALDRVSADGRPNWDCHWCGAQTPVGFSHCPDHVSCQSRMRQIIIHLREALAVRDAW